MDREVGRLQTVVVAFEDMTEEERERAITYLLGRYAGFNPMAPKRLITAPISEPKFKPTLR